MHSHISHARQPHISGQQLAQAPPKKISLRSIHQPLHLLWVLCLLLLTTYYALDITIHEDSESKYALNFFFQTSFLILPLFLSSIVIKRHIPFLMTSFFWFIVSTSFYFSFGPMFFFFGSPESIERTQYIFHVTQEILWKVNFINYLGLFFTLSSYLLFSFLVPPIREIKPDIHLAKKVMWTFLSMGFFIKFFLILPKQMQLVSWTLPGTVIMLESLFHIGIFLLSYLAWKERIHTFKSLLLILVILDFIMAFFTLSKQQVLMTLLPFIFGYILAVKNLTRFFLLGGLMFGLYLMITPIITNARQLYLEAGQISQMSMQKRSEILYSSIYDESEEKSEQDWWRRLYYVSIQAFTMELYHNGEKGNTVRNLHYYLIPRFIWPEKPSMTWMGLHLNEIVTGYRSSSLGLGLYHEGYWNYGYVGVISFSIYIGFVLALLSYITIVLLSHSLWGLMPVVFLAIPFGFGSSSWFVPTYFGALIIYFGISIILYAFLRFTNPFL